jgi:hypothetical protein
MVTKSTTHHRCVANGIKFHYAEAGEGRRLSSCMVFLRLPMLGGIRSRP